MSISIAAAVVLSMTGLSATAAEPPSPSGTIKGGSVDAAPEGSAVAEVPDTAKGLIVKTTTAAPSDALLAATDDALGARADVIADEQLTGKVSTVDFDEAIPAAAADQVAAQVQERDDVEWAVPNRRFYAQGGPPVNKDDQHFALQRNLWSTIASPWGGYSIKAPALWRKTEGLASTVVAVIDTGILANHPDMAGKLVQGYDMITDPGTSLDGDGRDSDPHDQGDWNEAGQCGPGTRKSSSSWHGTFVAGQIAAVTNNGRGIAGVAPNVKVQPIRALGRCGGDLSDILAAIDQASKGPAKIVNLSLGGAPMSRSARDSVCEAFTYYAQRGHARGVTFIAAAGNDGANANLVAPASCSGYISVGATSAKGFSAIYSNIGSTVDLSAPGGDSTVEGSYDRILSLSNSGTQGPSANGYGYAYAEGTSMAAPQVAGAAALLYSLGFTTPGQLANAVYASVTPFRPWSRQYSAKSVGPDRYDLNCRAKNRRWCGRGILDLSRVQAPLTRPVVSGTPTIGEPMRTSLGTWVRTPSAKFSWRVGGVVRSTASVYWPTPDDVGKTITSTVSPALPAFAKLTNTSVATSAVPAGPAVTLAVSRTVGFGTNHVVKAWVEGATGGQVQLRTDAGQVVGTGNVVAGRVSIPVSGRALKPGGYALRAAYLGDASTPRASSPRKALTIKKLRSTVTTKLPRTVKKGKRATLRITVSERPDLFASPTGQVRVYDGKKRLVVKNLSSTGGGKKTIRLPKLKKGTHKIRVLYRGNGYIASDYSIYRKIKVT